MNDNNFANKHLGEILVEIGLITEDQLEEALKEQSVTHLPIGRICVDKGWVHEEKIIKVLGMQRQIPYFTNLEGMVNPEVAKLLPEKFSREHSVIPVRQIDDRIFVAMADPMDIKAIDEVQQRTGLNIEVMISTKQSILRSIDKIYRTSDLDDEIDSLISKFGKETVGVLRDGEDVSGDISSNLERITAPEILDLVIKKAVREGATDVHIDSFQSKLRVRYRIDGKMLDAMKAPLAFKKPLISRLKVLSGISIIERNQPQDGSTRVNVKGRDIDLRISCIPTVDGEKVVIRVLDSHSMMLRLSQLGMPPDTLQKIKGSVTQPYGLVLVTGPTGSGKTTTLYAVLNELNDLEKNIVAIEDPVEYRIANINQIQVGSSTGISFASGLRSILRQDPDVILVGEIRDSETASVTIQAAQTGHLVLSTLHTNDSVGAIIRLMDIGVKPFLVSSSVVCVIAQRLVRCPCVQCRVPYAPESAEVSRLGLDPTQDYTFYKPVGCGNCWHTGYRGRVGIFEILLLNQEIRTLVEEKAPSDLIRETAIKNGMITLYNDGVRKVAKGMTTVEEITEALKRTED